MSGDLKLGLNTGYWAGGPPTGGPPGRTGRETMSQEGRGQLRIYLGNAAGVGKTYDMLCEGHRRAERGADVVVGFVETHGRKQTAALVEGLEVSPRARIAYRGTTSSPSIRSAVCSRPWVSTKPTTTSVPRSARR